MNDRRDGDAEMTEWQWEEPQHMWRLKAVTFDTDGAHSEYECELCGVLLLVGPKGRHPEEC